MDQMTKGQRVGLKTHEMERDPVLGTLVLDGQGNPKPIPPRSFARVVEVNEGGQSGYVDLILTEAEREQAEQAMGAGRAAKKRVEAMTKRKFFHVSELEDAPED